MKPLAGGAIDDSDLAIRFIRQNQDVTVIIPGMYCVEEIEQNKAAILNKSPLSEEEKEKIEQIRRNLGNNFCRRCNYCQPCTAGINISGCFTFAGYLERYGLAGWAKERYQSMPVKASSCIECGDCESRCPYQLPIHEMLKICVREFEE